MTHGTHRVAPGLVFLLPAFLLGLLATTQVQTQSRRAFVPSPYSSQDSVKLTEAALALQREEASLKIELGGLRVELADVQSRGANVSAEAGQVYAQIDQLREAAGLSEVSGPGIVITLDDARLPATRDVRSIVSAIVHSEDITDVINAAWAGGARAIAVNDERITGASACVGSTIQINGTLMSPPFRITVVGQTDELQRALNDPRTLADLRARKAIFGLGFDIARADDLRIAAYSGALNIRYATAR